MQRSKKQTNKRIEINPKQSVLLHHFLLDHDPTNPGGDIFTSLGTFSSETVRDRR